MLAVWARARAAGGKEERLERSGAPELADWRAAWYDMRQEGQYWVVGSMWVDFLQVGEFLQLGILILVWFRNC